MPKFILTLFCLNLTLHHMIASETSTKTENFGIAFDDFPDNSAPDFEALDEFPIAKKFKEFDSQPDLDDTVALQSELGIHSFDCPNTLVNGSVSVITGEFIENARDFSFPGNNTFDIQRSYHSGKCCKQSIHYGWQLNHGGKLFTWRKHNHKHAFVNGGIRQGVHYKEDYYEPYLKCPEYFFRKWVTNHSLGSIQAANNFKNDKLYHRDHAYHLITADDSNLWFALVYYDSEKKKGSRSYCLEKYDLPDGTSYRYGYGASFGMPTSFSLLNRNNQEIQNVKLEKSPSKYEFTYNPELIYSTSTGEKITYRFMIYGNHDRAIL